MSSNIEIRRICAWCKQEFIAHKTTTTCCSHRCANLLYKQKKREASIRANNQVVEKVIKEKPIEKIRDKPILTITEAATYIGVTRPTLYSSKIPGIDVREPFVFPPTIMNALASWQRTSRMCDKELIICFLPSSSCVEGIDFFCSSLIPSG